MTVLALDHRLFRNEAVAKLPGSATSVKSEDSPLADLVLEDLGKPCSPPWCPALGLALFPCTALIAPLQCTGAARTIQGSPGFLPPTRWSLSLGPAALRKRGTGFRDLSGAGRNTSNIIGFSP